MSYPEGPPAWDLNLPSCVWGEVETSGQWSSSCPCPRDNEDQVLLVEGRGRTGMSLRRFCLVRNLLYKWPQNPVRRMESDLMRQNMGKGGNTQWWQIKGRNWCPSNRRQEEKRLSWLSIPLRRGFPFLGQFNEPKRCLPQPKAACSPSPTSLLKSLLLSP